MDRLDKIMTLPKEDFKTFLKSLNKYQAAPCKMYKYGNFDRCPQYKGNCEACFDAYLLEESD